MDASGEKNRQSESRNHQSAEGRRRCASRLSGQAGVCCKEHAIGLLYVTGYHGKEPMFFYWELWDKPKLLLELPVKMKCRAGNGSARGRICPSPVDLRYV